ncbi:GNAT family N-acetyltransferase [Sporomusa sp.]|uniref:GNAT family N-acetyltransferase n=1 Tax=Sporomusa sp. TaxID=2078658 RepID=UPI002C577C1B|nr:GNAT family N-acetyltransferase [Sporomusa sp.]HWR44488.1 GNAT family N-acetyltransferase [Sporomusa sp.]
MDTNKLIETIETKRLVLRKMKVEDAEALFRYWSDSEVTRHMNISLFETIDQALEMITFLSGLFDKAEAFRWTIILKDSGDIVGSCGYNSWNKENQRGEIGYELGRAYWGKGIMTEALTGLLEYGFVKLDMNRIQALVEPANIPSIQLLRKLGFREEGLLRQYEQSKGHFIDLIMFAKLRSETVL